MNPALASFRQLPLALKFAAALIAIHALIYARGVGQNALLGNHIYPIWIAHVLLCVFLITRIGRPKRSMFYVFVAYCIVIPTNILRTDYVRDSSIGDLLSQMSPAIFLAAPLYAAGIAFFLGRKFYLEERPVSSSPEVHR